MSLGFRQTLIPPLLTAGVLLLVFAALPQVMAADSAFAAIDQWVAILCAILGVVLLATGVLNMLLVSRQLSQAR